MYSKVSEAAYWSQRYAERDIPWDLGHASRPLINVINALQDKHLRILEPGGGLGHEVAYLHEQGFPNACLLDFSGALIHEVKQRYPHIPGRCLLAEDFFAHTGTYDLILEQTFFCAIDPGLRDAYTDHMAELLVPGGELTGVLFEFPFDPAKGPPWGGDRNEYRRRLERRFELLQLHTAPDSEPPRQGSEVFFRARKPIATS